MAKKNVNERCIVSIYLCVITEMQKKKHHRIFPKQPSAILFENDSKQSNFIFLKHFMNLSNFK